ncbi:hypothetical protein RUND412_008030 [Rhizina undulata]
MSYTSGNSTPTYSSPSLSPSISPTPVSRRSLNRQMQSLTIATHTMDPDQLTAFLIRKRDYHAEQYRLLKEQLQNNAPSIQPGSDSLASTHPQQGPAITSKEPSRKAILLASIAELQAEKDMLDRIKAEKKAATMSMLRSKLAELKAKKAVFDQKAAMKKSIRKAVLKAKISQIKEKKAAIDKATEELQSDIRITIYEIDILHIEIRTSREILEIHFPAIAEQDELLTAVQKARLASETLENSLDRRCWELSLTYKDLNELFQRLLSEHHNNEGRIMDISE